MHVYLWGFPGDSNGKESTHNAGDLGSIPGLGRSPEEGMVTPVFLPGEFPFPMDRGAWRPAVHGVAKSRTRLSD